MNIRDQILDDLSRLYSLDQLNETEYEKRVSLVIDCPDDTSALTKINADILPPARYTQLPTSHPTTINNDESHKDVTAIFSGNSLKGDFIAPARISAAAIFGGIEIDLRKATIPAGGIYIEAAAIFGGIEIYLPDTICLRCDGTAIMGGIEKPATHGNPSGPVVHIKGTAIMGGIDVRFPKRRKNYLED